MSGELIHIIEDEREIAELIRDYLEDEGYNVMISDNGKTGFEESKRREPDLVVLDLMLPSMDGFEVCRSLRMTTSIPIIILSSKTSDLDKVLALGIGADDYLTKPFSSLELVARIKALIRRSKNNYLPTVQNVLHFGEIHLDLEAHNVFRNDDLVALTNKEYELFKLLALNPGRVLTKDQIIEVVWGNNFYGDDNTIPVHIRKLREKVEKNPSQPLLIQTVWGIGYRFTGGKGYE